MVNLDVPINTRQKLTPEEKQLRADQIVASVDFEKGIVWIKWIGTHSEYDKINVREVKYEKS